LQVKDQEYIQSSDDHSQLERNTEKEVQADCSADYLGDVSRNDRYFGQQPQHHGNRFGVGITTGLRQVSPRGDGEARAQRLKDDRHDV